MDLQRQQSGCPSISQIIVHTLYGFGVVDEVLESVPAGHNSVFVPFFLFDFRLNLVYVADLFNKQLLHFPFFVGT